MKTVRRVSIFLASIVACVFFGALQAPAKPVSYLPANALNTTAVESDQPNIRIFEQRGLLPYKGKSCHDEGTLWWTVDGKEGVEVHENEYFEVHFGFMQFKGEHAKYMMDQYRKPSPIDGLREEYKEKVKALKGTQFAPTLVPVLNGELLIWQEKIGCIEARYSGYVRTSFRGASMGDFMIFNMSGSYNSHDASMAASVYNEIASNVLRSMRK